MKCSGGNIFYSMLWICNWNSTKAIMLADHLSGVHIWKMQLKEQMNSNC